MAGEARFKKLLEPYQIGAVKTRNRMIKTGAGSLGLVKWYEAVAKGGIGLIIAGQCGVDEPLGVHFPPQISRHNYDNYLQSSIDGEKYLPYWSKFTQLIHKHGCPVFLQLSHWGPSAFALDVGLQPVSASALTKSDLLAIHANELFGFGLDLPREATVAEIQKIENKFATAAERAKRAGFDGIEIDASTQSLCNSFLSRVWNRRHDSYGCDSLENRSRFLVEIIREIKRRLGPDFPISIIYNVIEYGIDNGITLEDSLGFAKILQDAGTDAIHVRPYGYGYILSGHMNIMQQPEKLLYPEPFKPLPKELDFSHKGAGATWPLAAAIKKVVSIPVIAAGNMDPVVAANIIREGKADFIGILRGLVADPDLPNKIAAGRLEDVAPCTTCSNCEGIISSLKPRSVGEQFRETRSVGEQCRVNVGDQCRVNAKIESHYECPVKPAEKKKRVVVVGGGPAGMEAARVAAMRGHEVTLYEKETKLGGLLPLAAIVKGTDIEDLPALVRYLKTQITKLGVNIRLGQEITPAMIEEAKPDVVILAVGGTQSIPDIPGVDRPNVVSNTALHRMLKSYLRFLNPGLLSWLTKFWMPIGKRVVVIGGGIQGCELAEFLVKRGKKVTIVDTAETLGEGLSESFKFMLLLWLEKKGMAMMPGVKYEEITDKGLTVITREGKRQTIEADTIVSCLPLLPNTKLFESLKPKVPQIYIVGDSRNQGLIVDAIGDGYRTSCAI
jgi:2,4-dienoyl-CoA reductase (NADPH2)